MMDSLFDVEPVIGTGKDNEWYTPQPYINAARDVMGGIDLDPASCEKANRIVKADRYYTKEENGLLLPWYGRVWLNPPYGRVNGSGASVIRMFVEKLVYGYSDRAISQAILLTTVQTNSTWFQLLWEYPICFTSHRVAFMKPNNGRIEADSRTTHALGTALVYLGPNEQTFIDVFSQFGPVVKSVSQHKAKPATLPLWEGSVA